MKVLITGAAGRIGRKILPALAAKYDLVLTDQYATEIDGHPVHALDITDYDAVLDACRGMDAIVHLAIASIRDIITDRDRFLRHEGKEYLKFNQLCIEANVRGTYHIFEAARHAGVSRVIFGSSLTVYLGTPGYEKIQDDLAFRPSNFYAVTKCWGEQLGEFFSRTHGLKVYCLRFGTPYPQGEKAESQSWLQVPVGRRTFVTYEDVAASVEAALTAATAPSFAAYTIVSSTEGCAFDYSAAREIGWEPRYHYEADGSITPVRRQEALV